MNSEDVVWEWCGESSVPVIECKTHHEVAARLQHAVTPHEAPHLPLAVLHQFTNLRSPGAGGSEDDHAQVQLTPTVPLTAALTLLEPRTIL